MRKGLTTLMTVALVMVSAQAALAYAPVISQIPSPIVGNKQSASQPQAYLYPDAFDLNTLVQDDNTPVDQLKWSYEIVTTPGNPQRYAINGDDMLVGADNPINPPAAKVINVQWNGKNDADAANDANPDAKQNTITIRDIRLHPYGGTPSTSQSGPAWESQAVTFWCSDGNLATSSVVMFYTDNTYHLGAAVGINRLSNVNVWTKMREDKLLNTANWSMYDPFFDHTTSGTWGDGKGLCLNVTQTGQNWGSVATPMGFVTLVDNAVYRIRLQMNCNQVSSGKTPMWDFILENWNGDATKGINLYGVDNYFLDNEGGANAIIQQPLGTEVTMIWAPAAFQTRQWRNTTNGIFAANAAPPAGSGINYTLVRDAALRFRVLDLDARADLQNDRKFGSICMQNVIVETCPIGKRIYEVTGTATAPAAAQNLYGVGAGAGTGTDVNLKGVHNTVGDNVPGNMMASALLGSSMSYTGGILTLTPSANGASTEIVTITPAKDTAWDTSNMATIADDFPIPWESNKIYELEVKMSAPSRTHEAHPWDVLWLNMEPPTNEIITESYITATKGIATPKFNEDPAASTRVPQSYYLYYYSGNKTKSAVTQYGFLRWRIRWGNSTNLDWPNPADTTNTGAVTIHSVKVNKVKFQ